MAQPELEVRAVEAGDEGVEDVSTNEGCEVEEHLHRCCVENLSEEEGAGGHKLGGERVLCRVGKGE